MYRRLMVKSGFALLVVLIVSGPALAASLSQSAASDATDWSILAIALTFLLPIGLILLSVAAFPDERAISATTGALVAWGLATLAYFAVGFAFQFGGIAVYHDDPDLAGLYWEYSLLDISWGTGWGMIGLRGFLLLGEASTPGALTLFLSQLPLLGVATVVPYFALQGRARRWIALFASLLMGSLVYPIIGNWTWASGWLANLGYNLAQGHGLLDVGGSGQLALVGASAALAALLVFRHQSAGERPEAPTVAWRPEPAPMNATLDEAGELSQTEGVPMPPAHFPLLGLLGAGLMIVGWMGLTSMSHLPTAVDLSPVPMAVNLILGGLGGTLTAGLYSWFTTSRLNPLMAARGLVAGLVVVAAGAPFIPAWSALTAGLVVGLLLPPLIFLFDRVLRLEDSVGALATFGLPALLGLVLPGLVADGRYGVGWNGIGADSFLGVTGQGVSGWLTAPGLAPDWPGQLYAQLIGAAAIFAWSFGCNWLLMRGLVGLIRAWERSGLELGVPPVPVGVEEEASPSGDQVYTIQGRVLEPGGEEVPSGT